MMRIWDSHTHLFPDRLLQAIWKWFARAGWHIPFSGRDPESLYESLQQTGAERAFLLPYAHKPDISQDLNRWVRDFCRGHPLLVPFASVHPGDADIMSVLEPALDQWGFAGIKLQLAVLQCRADDPSLYPVYRAALLRNKPVVVHAGTAPYQPHHPEYGSLGLERLWPVLDAFPGLRLIIPHLGLNQLDEAIALLEAHPGVHLDTSWALGHPDLHLDHAQLRDLFQAHPDRILYGSDFPLIEHDPLAGFRALRELELKPDTQELILWRNAGRLVKDAGWWL
jgi:hypothetical protein